MLSNTSKKRNIKRSLFSLMGKLFLGLFAKNVIHENKMQKKLGKLSYKRPLVLSKY